MAAPSLKPGLTATPPTFAVKGAHNSLLMAMPRMGPNPASGRLLRGLTPYLDEQGASHVFLLTERRRREPWSADPEQRVPYQELIHWARHPNGGVYRGVCVKGEGLRQDDVIQAFQYEPLSLIEWAARRADAAVIASNEPLRLTAAEVPKPWGREIWYTGIEKRGVSGVHTASGRTELPYAMGMFPVPLIGEKEVPPILLKVLDPLAEPIYGDLYLEVHREKWETYMVLDVDRRAWPDGVGYLRAGLEPAVLEHFHREHGARWEEALEAELAGAIKAYEAVRRDIDGRLDEALRERGHDPEVPVAPALHRELLATVPEALHQREAELRAAVEAYLGRAPLRPGDVVTLPPGVLHSLQHGVRVIEFQTPTYERLIAMFAQKVLTQPHWDTEDALRLMHKASYEPPAPTVLEESNGLRVERVVDFPQFQVERFALALNARVPQRTEGANRYRLLFVTEGKGELRLPHGSVYTLEPGSAFLLPAALGDYEVSGITAQGVTFLQGFPALDAPPPPEPGDEVEEQLSRLW